MMPCLPLALANSLEDRVCNTPIDGSPGVAVPKKRGRGIGPEGLPPRLTTLLVVGHLPLQW